MTGQVNKTKTVRRIVNNKGIREARVLRIGEVPEGSTRPPTPLAFAEAHGKERREVLVREADLADTPEDRREEDPEEEPYEVFAEVLDEGKRVKVKVLGPGVRVLHDEVEPKDIPPAKLPGSARDLGEDREPGERRMRLPRRSLQGLLARLQARSVVLAFADPNHPHLLPIKDRIDEVSASLAEVPSSRWRTPRIRTLKDPRVYLAGRHKEAVLTLCADTVLRSAGKRIRKLVDGGGTFGVSVDAEDLVSLAKFRSALRGARGSHTRRSKVRTWAQYDPGDPKAEVKKSLSVDLPNDAAEDTSAQVLGEVAGIRGKANPCLACPRRFPLSSFLAEVAGRALTEEQEGLLAGVLSRIQSGELQEACPLLWSSIGVSLRSVIKAGSSLPYGIEADKVERQKGPRAGTRTGTPCRLLGVVSYRAVGASTEYVFRSARRGRFEDTRQDAEGDRIPVSEVAESVPDPEAGPEDRSARDLLEDLRIALRGSSRKVTFGARLERVLDVTSEAGSLPSAQEVADLFGTSLSQGERVLRRFREVVFANLPEDLRNLVA